MRFQSGRASRKSLVLTIYNGFAAVKEVRNLNAEEEVDLLILEDLPGEIEADSFIVKRASVMEQTYEPGYIDKERMLKRHIGQVVTIRNGQAAEDKRIRLLGAGQDLIGEIEGTGEIVINPSGDIFLPPLEGGMASRPAISCRIEPALLPGDVELHYLVSGLWWEANYTAELTEDRLLLTGWMKITNYAGADFENAKLKAVAAAVNRAGNEFAKAASFQTQPEESGSSASHVYAIGRSFSLSDGQTMQLKFMKPQELIFQRVYKIEKNGEHASIQLQFGGGSGRHGLAVSLPQGKIKFYGRDEDGDLEFIGEDRIGHTAAKEKMKVKIGENFRITSKAREKERKVIDGSEYVTIEYLIKNSQQENAAVLLEHTVHDRLWEMESSSHDYEMLNSQTLEFHVRIAAEKTVLLEFTYKCWK